MRRRGVAGRERWDGNKTDQKEEKSTKLVRPFVVTAIVVNK